MKLRLDVRGQSPYEAPVEVDIWTLMEWAPCNDETEGLLIGVLRQLLSSAKTLSVDITVDVTLDIHDPTMLVDLVASVKNGSSPKVKACKLTPREIEVLDLIMEGYTNKEIADKIFVCTETVKSHRKNILEKTGCRNMPMLINIYHQSSNVK